MYLNQLTGQEKAHWELHIKACQNDALPKDKSSFNVYLNSKVELPALANPSYVQGYRLWL